MTGPTVLVQMRHGRILYEGTFAHEFEHLIHFDIDPDEPSWVDEGLADLAGYICGYGHSAGHIAYYMVYHPFTALTFWGGGLEDYGVSYLFQLYLFEKFGEPPLPQHWCRNRPMVSKVLKTPWLPSVTKRRFDEIFDNWTVANYLDDTNKAGGKYGYETLDIGTYRLLGLYNTLCVWKTSGGARRMLRHLRCPRIGYGDPQPYTAQYYRFTNDKKPQTFGSTVMILPGLWLTAACMNGTPTLKRGHGAASTRPSISLPAALRLIS